MDTVGQIQVLRCQSVQKPWFHQFVVKISSYLHCVKQHQKIAWFIQYEFHKFLVMTLEWCKPLLTVNKIKIKIKHSSISTYVHNFKDWYTSYLRADPHSPHQLRWGNVDIEVVVWTTTTKCIKEYRIIIANLHLTPKRCRKLVLYTNPKPLQPLHSEYDPSQAFGMIAWYQRQDYHQRSQSW